MIKCLDYFYHKLISIDESNKFQLNIFSIKIVGAKVLAPLWLHLTHLRHSRLRNLNFLVTNLRCGRNNLALRTEAESKSEISTLKIIYVVSEITTLTRADGNS